MIRAEVHTDDYIETADFDATPFFVAATADDIIALCGCDWGGDYPADDVASFCRDHDTDVEMVMAYNEDARIGFECHVNKEDAFAWLRSNRPEVYAAIAEYDLDNMKG